MAETKAAPMMTNPASLVPMNPTAAAVLQRVQAAATVSTAPATSAHAPPPAPAPAQAKPPAPVPAPAASVVLTNEMVHGKHEIFVLNTDAEVEDFLRVTCRCKFLIIFAEWCGPCKAFTPVYTAMAPPKGWVPKEGSGKEADPADDVLFGAIESKNVELIKSKVPGFPFQGFPTTVVMRENKVEFTVQRGAPTGTAGWPPQEAVIFAQLENKFPGVMNSPTMGYVTSEIRNKAIELSKVPGFGMPQQQASNPNPSGPCNNPNCPNCGPKLAAAAAAAAKSVPAAPPSPPNSTAPAPSNGTALPPAPPLPAYLTAIPDAKTIAASSVDSRSTLSGKVRTTWVHSIHPNWVNRQLAASCYLLVKNLRDKYRMPWIDQVDPNLSTATPTLYVVNHCQETGLASVATFSGDQALEFLGGLHRSFSS